MQSKTIFIFFILLSNIQIAYTQVYFDVAISPAPNWANCGGCWDAPWRIGWPFYGYGYGPGYGFTPPATGYQRPIGIVPYVYKNPSHQAIDNDNYGEEYNPDLSDISQESSDI